VDPSALVTPSPAEHLRRHSHRCRVNCSWHHGRLREGVVGRHGSDRLTSVPASAASPRFLLTAIRGHSSDHSASSREARDIWPYQDDQLASSLLLQVEVAEGTHGELHPTCPAAQPNPGTARGQRRRRLTRRSLGSNRGGT
jgi:hypothetical protein